MANTTKSELGERIVAAAVLGTVLTVVFTLLVLFTPAGGLALMLGTYTGWWTYPAVAFSVIDAYYIGGIIAGICTLVVIG